MGLIGKKNMLWKVRFSGGYKNFWMIIFAVLDGLSGWNYDQAMAIAWDVSIQCFLFAIDKQLNLVYKQGLH